MRRARARPLVITPRARPRRAPRGDNQRRALPSRAGPGGGGPRGPRRLRHALRPCALLWPGPVGLGHRNARQKLVRLEQVEQAVAHLLNIRGLSGLGLGVGFGLGLGVGSGSGSGLGLGLGLAHLCRSDSRHVTGCSGSRLPQPRVWRRPMRLTGAAREHGQLPLLGGVAGRTRACRLGQHLLHGARAEPVVPLQMGLPATV